MQFGMRSMPKNIQKFLIYFFGFICAILVPAGVSRYVLEYQHSVIDRQLEEEEETILWSYARAYCDDLDPTDEADDPRAVKLHDSIRSEGLHIYLCGRAAFMRST